jgi:hypothetical protein
MAQRSTLPKELTCAVGRVVINFQILEFTIIRLIWIMAFTDAYASECKTAGVPFSKLLDLLSSAFHKHIQTISLVERFDDLILRAHGINGLRNRIVHSWWFTDLDGGQPSRMKLSRKSFQQDLEAIDMNAVSIAALNLTDDFEKFIDELYQAKLIRKKPGISLSSLADTA